MESEATISKTFAAPLETKRRRKEQQILLPPRPSTFMSRLSKTRNTRTRTPTWIRPRTFRTAPPWRASARRRTSPPPWRSSRSGPSPRRNQRKKILMTVPKSLSQKFRKCHHRLLPSRVLHRRQVRKCDSLSELIMVSVMKYTFKHICFQKEPLPSLLLPCPRPSLPRAPSAP